MIKKVIFLCLGLMFFPSFVAAQDSQLSYSFVGAGYNIVDVDGDDYAGFQIYGSAAISQNVFIFGSFASIESDDEFVNIITSEIDEISLDQVGIGLGFHTPVNEVADFFVTIQYIDAEAEFGSLSDDDNGYGISVGLRSKPTEVLELTANINHVDIADDGETGFGLGARAYAAEKLSFGISYSSADDVDGFFFNIRADM